MSAKEPKTPLFTPAGANLVVNVFSFLCLVALAATGLGVLEDLKPGQSFLGIPRDAWEETHERFGFLMLGIIAYHLVRHRSWLLSVFQGKLLGDAASRKRTWIAIGMALVVFLAIVVASLV